MSFPWKPALWHQGFKALIMAGFTLFILYLSVTGDMLFYLAPNLILYVELASLILLGLTVFQTWQLFGMLKKPAKIESGQRLAPRKARLPGKPVFLYGLFLLPLLLGGFLPNTAMGGSLAEAKGMNLGGSSVVNGSNGGDGAPAELVELDGNFDPALKELFRTDVYNKDYAKLGMLLYQQDVIEMKDEWFIEKLQAMNTFVDNFQNKPITITGFVYRQEGLAGNQFIIGRMAMTHCIADISPYGIVAEAVNAGQYKDDAWITLTGTIGETVVGGLKVIKINAESIQPAKAPQVPYVYPDWEFGSKL